jgi:hypothetical protein
MHICTLHEYINFHFENTSRYKMFHDVVRHDKKHCDSSYSLILLIFNYFYIALRVVF